MVLLTNTYLRESVGTDCNASITPLMSPTECADLKRTRYSYSHGHRTVEENTGCTVSSVLEPAVLIAGTCRCHVAVISPLHTH